jgi:hypothetical protein
VARDDADHDVLTSHGLASVPDATSGYTGGVASIYVLFLIIGVSLVGRSLPFALALGVSRRSYYAGSAVLGAALAVADGLGLAGLQAVERATDGWGVQMDFFRVPYFLAGPWYLTCGRADRAARGAGGAAAGGRARDHPPRHRLMGARP